MMFEGAGGRMKIWRARPVKIAEIRRPFRIDGNELENRDKYIFEIRKKRHETTIFGRLNVINDRRRSRKISTFESRTYRFCWNQKVEIDHHDYRGRRFGRDSRWSF